MKEDYRAARTYAEISLPRIARNLEAVRGLLGPGCKLMSVLKANAYGHGAAGCVPAFEQGTDWYAVATIDEALELRRAGARKEILVFGWLPPEAVPAAAGARITVSLFSAGHARAVYEALEGCPHRLQVQFKVDTGLNRTGFPCREDTMEECLQTLGRAYAGTRWAPTGIFTHFACADSPDPGDIAFSGRQFRLFDTLCRRLGDAGVRTGARHCCSSAATLLHPEWRMDMARVGMLAYGQCMTEAERVQYGLLPALSWRARVIDLRGVPRGESVSYGRMFRAGRDTRVAVIAAGYADGYRRAYKGTSVLLHGRRAPVAGRICMDFLMADVTGVPGVRAGDEATLLGEDSGAVIAPNELAAFDSVNGEVTCAISARVPRRYVKGDGQGL